MLTADVADLITNVDTSCEKAERRSRKYMGITHNTYKKTVKAEVPHCIYQQLFILMLWDT